MAPTYLLALSIDRWLDFVSPEDYIRIIWFLDFEPRVVSRLIGDLLRDLAANNPEPKEW